MQCQGLKMKPGELKSFFLETYSHFNVDKCRLMAGAMAYYTLFALPILLVISFNVTAFFFGSERAQEHLQQEVVGLVGTEGAKQVEIMLSGAGKRTQGAGFATVFAVILLFYGALRAFEQLQVALNTVWGIDIAPAHRNMRTTLRKRIFSFFIVWGVIAILAASLFLSIILMSIGQAATAEFNRGFSRVLFSMGDVVGSGVVIAILLMLIFKLLPDVNITWRDVRFGAIFTAILFVICKTVIGIFLGRSDFGTVYGAAGSMAILLVWIYCSALILLFGAEVTKVWATRYGSRFQPTPGAAKVVTEYIECQDSETQSTR